jgi:hypothetical protein
MSQYILCLIAVFKTINGVILHKELGNLSKRQDLALFDTFSNKT